MAENEVKTDVPVEEKEDKKVKKGKAAKNEELECVKAELASAQAEAEENKRKWYAVSAEYENYRRRTAAQAAQRYSDGRNDMVASLFPVGDNLLRALSVCSDENTKKGLEMVLASFDKILEAEGVEVIDPIGQAFDPSLAEAIMAMPAAEGEESGIVKMVHEKGYKKGDKVLRYAKVVVTQ